jgi:hypothetical protein
MSQHAESKSLPVQPGTGHEDITIESWAYDDVDSDLVCFYDEDSPIWSIETEWIEATQDSVVERGAMR